MAYDIGQGTALIARNQVVYGCNGGSKTSDDEVAVQKHRRYLGAVEQIVQVAVGVVEFIYFFRQSNIDCVQSSLSDCISSFEVSSSSLVDCISSLTECNSSFALRSSSRAV